jgi:phosphoribosylformylglycinamidine synthase
LLVVKQGYEDKVKAVFQKWEIPCVVLGRVAKSSHARVYNGTELVADLPTKTLVEAPTYRLKGVLSPEEKAARDFPLASLPLPQMSPEQVLLKLLSAPNIASKAFVYRQYDHQVQNNTVVPPSSDAAVLRIKGTKRGIAISIDGNGRYCHLDPYQGGAMAVAEACRNVSCVGAEPVALTDCLNFGNPERPEIYYQLEWCVRGMAKACRVLGVPVVSGNVSLYNETEGQAVLPTPVVGALGLLEDVAKHATQGFKQEGDVVVLLGSGKVTGRSSALAGSELVNVLHAMDAGRPYIDLGLEARVQVLCRRAITEGLVRSAHDCSDGGLAVALAESCIGGGIGFRGEFTVTGRWDAALFGETQSRIVVSVPEKHVPALERLARQLQVPLVRLGVASARRFFLPDYFDLAVEGIDRAWRFGLEQALK